MDEQVSHVLYFSMDCKVCHALRGMGIPYGVRLENVHDISPRPAWLDGTPTLVDVSVGVLYKGTDALIVLENMRQTQAYQQPPRPEPPPVRPQGPSVPSRPSFPRPIPNLQPEQQAEPQQSPRTLRPVNDSSPSAPWTSAFNTVDIPDVVVDNSKVTEASIAEMMSRRAAQLPVVNKPLM